MFERACRSEDLPAFGGPANATCATPSDRKSTRLNSSHDQISYAVFCLKKKKKPCTLRPERSKRWREPPHSPTCLPSLCLDSRAPSSSRIADLDHLRSLPAV